MAIRNKINAALPQASNFIFIEKLVAQQNNILYLGRQKKSQTPVFLFVLNETAKENPELAAEFVRRAEKVADLDHPHLSPVLEWGETEDGRLFTAVAHTEGPTLAEFLQTSPEAPSLPATNVLAFMLPIAEVLLAAEQAQLVHHDLTPASIIMPNEDTGYLFDLVLPAAENNDHPQNFPEQMLPYQSPEQLAGEQPSIRSNIYSFGIVLYELLAGHRPALPTSEWDIFEHKGIPRGIPLEEAKPGLMPATYELVKNCIWQKEWSRYQSFQQVIEALLAALAAEREGPAPPPMLPLERRTLMIGGAAVLLLLLLIGGFFAVRGLTGGDQAEAVMPTAVIPSATPTQAQVEENAPPAAAPPVEVPATDTATATATLQPTATPSPTATQTATPTATSAPTETATPEDTAVPTETATPEETACVPSPPPGWVQYAIQEGDYLYNLAVNTGRTVERIQEVNCLTGNILRLNQRIWLPRLPVHTPTPEPILTVTAESTNSTSVTPNPSATQPSNPPPPPQPTNPPGDRPTRTPPPPDS